MLTLDVGFMETHHTSYEIIKMYDSNNNEFFRNCSSKDEAEKLIQKLKKKGKEAIIGPRAPVDIYGEKINYENDDFIGVYIVKDKEEKNIDIER